jgi:hypothetical protein
VDFPEKGRPTIPICMYVLSNNGNDIHNIRKNLEREPEGLMIFSMRAEDASLGESPVSPLSVERRCCNYGNNLDRLYYNEAVRRDSSKTWFRSVAARK